MADNHSLEIRSYNMSRIRSKDTKPEILLRSRLFYHGFRFRINDKKYFGKPDVILPKHKTVIFVNGCFWHSHTSCKYFRLPQSRQSYWLPKLEKTKKRDEIAHQYYRDRLWNCLVVWECQLKPQTIDSSIHELIEKIGNTNNPKKI